MSEIGINKEALRRLLESLNNETLDFIKSVVNGSPGSIPQNFSFSGSSAIWEQMPCDHFELEITLGN